MASPDKLHTQSTELRPGKASGPVSKSNRAFFKLSLGPVVGWLPGVALFLCLAMFAMAGLTLLNVNADPQSPPAANAVSLSAQGFTGLRRLLDATGYTTILNRFSEGPNVARGDLEIITLESPGVHSDPDLGDDQTSADASASAQSSVPAPAGQPAASPQTPIQTPNKASSGDT